MVQDDSGIYSEEREVSLPFGKTDTYPTKREQDNYLQEYLERGHASSQEVLYSEKLSEASDKKANVHVDFT